MPIHNPPQYRYALFESWDKEAFDFIKQIGSQKNYPKITGAEDDKNKFLIILIRTQKSLHDWRDFLKDMLTQIMHNGVIDTKSLNEKYPPESISKEKPAWVTYEEDKIVNNFIDELAINKGDPAKTIDSIRKVVEEIVKMGKKPECVLLLFHKYQILIQNQKVPIACWHQSRQLARILFLLHMK